MYALIDPYSRLCASQHEQRDEEKKKGPTEPCRENFIRLHALREMRTTYFTISIMEAHIPVGARAHPAPLSLLGGYVVSRARLSSPNLACYREKVTCSPLFS